MNSKILILLILCIFLSGCATLRSKSVYTIPINTIPENASINVTDQDGNLIISTRSPDTLVLKAGAGYFKRAEYSIEVSHPDYQTKKETFYFIMDEQYIYNTDLVFFMLIGFLIVDPLSGAMWAPERNEIKITLNPITWIR